MQLSKTTWAVVVLIVAVAGLGLVWLQQPNSSGSPAGDSADGYVRSAIVPSVMVPGDEADSAAGSGSAPVRALTYEAALEQYTDRRIQIVNCAATPASQTYKNGTRVMLDNRSTSAVTLTLAGRTHQLGSYTFKLVNLTSTKLPATLQMNCRQGSTVANNVARLLIQP